MGTKIAGATVLVLLVVTVFAYIEVSRHERQTLLAARKEAGTTIATLFAAGVVAPITFGDEKGQQEQTALLMVDTDVIYAAVWCLDASAPGGSLAKVAEARRGAIRMSDATVHIDIRVRRSKEAVLFEVPVIDARGSAIGVAQVAFSLAKEDQAIAAIERRTLIGAGAMAFGVAVVLLALIRTIIVRRLARLAAAAKGFESGEVVAVDIGGDDEVTALARAFSAMRGSIALRERRIAERNRDMRLVLDNVAEGFLTVDLAGTVSEERSRILDDWFGAPSAAQSFFEYLDRIAPEATPWIRIGWASLEDGFLPVEVVLDQLSRQFERNGRSFELEFRPIEEVESVSRILVVVRDVTERAERERAEVAQREAMAIFRRMLGDRAGFEELMTESSALVASVVDRDATDGTCTFRALHTLKGITALFGIESVSHYCHELEASALERGDRPNEQECAQLGALWSAVCALHAQLSGAKTGCVEVPADDYAQLLAALASNASSTDLTNLVTSWRDERAATRLERLAAQATHIGRTLGRPIATHITVSPPDLRLPADRWSRVWAVLAHVLRNAIDHGIESPDQRAASGKGAEGSMSFTCVRSTEDLILTISDDGRGIAWDKLRVRAAARGLPVTTNDDLVEALFADAVSTKDRLTEISGRGIGLAAVREVVRAEGGSITVSSSPGEGTAFRIRLPAT